MSVSNALVLFSGGPDSVVLLMWALREYDKVGVITFLYGQKNIKELAYAWDFLETLTDVEHKNIDIRGLGEILPSALTQDFQDVSKEAMGTDAYIKGVKETIVPNRNAIFLSIAVGYAVSHEYDDVLYGAHFSPGRLYPDTRWEFVEAMSFLAKLATENQNINIVAPFVKMTKGEVFKLGEELEVPFEMTWSCYEDEEKHCGECPACRKRKQAFVDAGIKDPTEYLK